VKAEEVERAERLQTMLDQIAEAEQRAEAAERRARESVARVAEPIPEIDAETVLGQAAPEAEPEPASESEPEPRTTPEAPEAAVDRDAAPEPEAFLPPGHAATSAPPPPPPAPAPPEPTVVPPSKPEPEGAGQLGEPPSEPLDLNSASYEDLRELGLSVTQTGRVLAYRERVGGFKSLDDLDAIPGFPDSFLTDFKTRLRV
jgi:hypothetical protein